MSDFTIPSTKFGDRVQRRLREELVGWLATTRHDGTPQPSPVWFWWDGESILIYSKQGTARTLNLSKNERTSFHFDGNGAGGDIVVFEGTAQLSGDPPSPDVPEYQDKYLAEIVDSLGLTAEGFAERYPVAIRFYPDRLRGH